MNTTDTDILELAADVRRTAKEMAEAADGRDRANREHEAACAQYSAARIAYRDAQRALFTAAADGHLERDLW